MSVLLYIIFPSYSPRVPPVYASTGLPPTFLQPHTPTSLIPKANNPQSLRPTRDYVCTARERDMEKAREKRLATSPTIILLHNMNPRTAQLLYVNNNFDGWI